jgi:hypothetical protein
VSSPFGEDSECCSLFNMDLFKRPPLSFPLPHRAILRAEALNATGRLGHKSSPLQTEGELAGRSKPELQSWRSQIAMSIRLERPR